MNNKKIIISIVLKITAIILIVVGVCLNIFGGQEFMAGSKSLLYFTIQSNILAAILCSIGVIFDFKRLKNDSAVHNKVFNYFQLVATTGVTLTLIVFWALLAQSMPPSYLYSVSNLALHTLGPLLVLLDYIFFTKNFKPSKKMLMVVWTFPLVYFAFAMILSLSSVDFGYGMRVPYFFLDYKELGWFNISNGNIGVFYWVIIILIIVYLIGLGIDSLNQLYMKRSSSKTKISKD